MATFGAMACRVSGRTLSMTLTILTADRMWYGFLTGTYFPICATSLFGQACAVVFLSVFYYYSDDRARIRRMGVIALTTVCPVVVFVVCAISGATNLSFTGAAHVMGGIGDAFAIIMLGSPLEKVKVVLKTKSARALPVPLCCMCLVNTSLWLTFGLTTNDVFVIVPNCFGVVMCSIQVALCVIYRGGGSTVVTDPVLLMESTDLELGARSDCASNTEGLRSPSLSSIGTPKDHMFETEYAALRSPSAAALVPTVIA
jgi:solute carrier family 50 protein (sugar transporter)